MEESREDYFQKKLASVYSNTCKCKKNEMCGLCFWKGITRRPNDIPECTKCKKDTLDFQLFAKDNKSTSMTFRLKCCKVCLQHDFYHMKREKIAKESNLTIKWEYK